MKLSTTINSCLLYLLCLLTGACSGTRDLPVGDKLYTGSTIRLESVEVIKHTNFIKTTAENAIRPLPNSSIFGMRPKVWIYLRATKFPNNKLYKWLNKYGQAPVLISQIRPSATAAILDATFFNIGIFESNTEYQIQEKKHTAKVLYISHIETPYSLKKVDYSISEDSINDLIVADEKNSLLIPGDNYNLDVLKNERIRIDALLKNKGYFYFSPEYLLFKSDTSKTEHTISLRLTLKSTTPKNARMAYRIHRVFIDPDYTLNSDTSKIIKDTIRYQNTVFLGKETEKTIRPGILLQSIYLKKAELYSRLNHEITLNRLMTMGTYKFVSVKFIDSDTVASGFLDATILMTPMAKRTFRAEIDFVSKSTNFMGPRMNFSYLNRNTFHGAELLSLNIAGTFEAQVGGNNLYSYSLAPQAEIFFPGILIPFKTIKTNSLYQPKTRLGFSYNYMKRVNYFDLRSLQFSYGFKWKKNIQKEQELNPIMVSFTSITNQSETFKELLTNNAFLKKSYEDQFIAGGSYSFIYNEQLQSEKKIQYYFHLTTEASGNAISLVKILSSEKRTLDKPFKILGSAYSQYAKLSMDFRSYYNFIDKNTLAVRFFAGVAKPYGNSTVLPYSKQFFSGGPNSIRAFSINSVGPGTYYQKANNSGFLQLGGDLKLEANAEYRFNIFRYFKGAVFADAGNSWLLQTNPTWAIKAFSFSEFPKEIAVGAGIGLRMDVTFFILRFDLATPLRKPWLTENNQWVINQIDILSPSWRRDNLILNIAIGYPF